MREYVVFRYSDGRLPPSRTVSVSAAKAHEIATDTDIEVVSGYDVYARFCEAHGHEVAALDREEPSPADEPEEVPATVRDTTEETAAIGDASDGWPDGYGYQRNGAWLKVHAPDGSELGNVRGENAAQELAWNHKNAESDEPTGEG